MFLFWVRLKLNLEAENNKHTALSRLSGKKPSKATIYIVAVYCSLTHGDTMRRLKPFFLLTDIGFILYWLITLLHLIPDEYLFNDYNNPILVAWNWSFLPLDLMISATGFTSLYLYNRNQPAWHNLALISLVLTFCSGLQAIAFFVMRADYDPMWWIPNLYLLLYPLPFIWQLVRQQPHKAG
jgi:hypothetical protein